MQNFNKPLYSIYPRMYCSGTVYVNDIPVVDWYGDETKDGGFGGDIMINQVLLQSGTYKVSGKMYPRTGKTVLDEDDMMSVDFYCSEHDRWKDSRTSFHPKIESAWDGLSENISYPYFEISTEIQVELPFILNGWQNSVDFRDVRKEELFSDVLQYYRMIRTALVEHNTEKFLELSSEKLDLYAQALYFTENRKNSFAEGIRKLFSQQLAVEDLDERKLRLEIIGNGKLLRLMNTDGSQPLQFKSPDAERQGNIELEVKLHQRVPGKNFSII